MFVMVFVNVNKESEHDKIGLKLTKEKLIDVFIYFNLD